MSSSVLDMVADLVLSPAGATPATGDTGDMGENLRQCWRDTGATKATNRPRIGIGRPLSPTCRPHPSSATTRQIALVALSPAKNPEIVASRVFRVLVAMDQGQAPRWTAMLGCTDMADARKSAAGTFAADRVLDIRDQRQHDDDLDDDQ